jgi:hypothetical protein
VAGEGAGKKYAILQREKSRFESRKKKEIPGMCPHNRETCLTGRVMPHNRDDKGTGQAFPASHARASQDMATCPPACGEPHCERSDSPYAFAEPISLYIWLAMAEIYQSMDCTEDREEEEDDDEQKERRVSWPQIIW